MYIHMVVVYSLLAYIVTLFKIVFNIFFKLFIPSVTKARAYVDNVCELKISHDWLIR